LTDKKAGFANILETRPTGATAHRTAQAAGSFSSVVRSAELVEGARGYIAARHFAQLPAPFRTIRGSAENTTDLNVLTILQQISA
jgi:hypothetical protein